MITFLSRETNAEALARLLGDHVELDVLGARDALVSGIAAYAAAAENVVTYQALHGVPAARGPARRTVICAAENHRDVVAAAKIVVDDARAAFMLLLTRLLETIGLDLARTIAEQSGSIRPGKYQAHPSTVIEEPVIIGRGAVLCPGVVVRRGTIIGENTLVAGGTVIGDHGPAVHRCANGRLLSWARIHVGTVRIGSGCEIGANSTIPRGILGQTRIGDGTIIGNNVHVGHGTTLGERCWLAAGCIVCGHTRVGDGVSFGAGSVVRDNVEIGANASIGMGSVVVNDIPAGASALGHPARPVERSFRSGPAR